MKEHHDLLPQFPRTPHIPFRPNAEDGDVIADGTQVEPLFNGENQIYVEEKIDGASAAIAVIDGEPVIRNRDHILCKGYMRKSKDTTAKVQFRSIWNWYYEHTKLFKHLYKCLGPVTVYGEWVLAQHGIYYDRLPSYFIAYDLFSHDTKKFIQTSITRGALRSSGFVVPPLIHAGVVPSYVTMMNWTHDLSGFSSDQQREGLYFKVYDGCKVFHRFKMVREDFVRGALWDQAELKKNCLF